VSKKAIADEVKVSRTAVQNVLKSAAAESTPAPEAETKHKEAKRKITEPQPEEEDSFERAKRIAGEGRKLIATLRSLKMPAPWADIAPELHKELRGAISIAFGSLEDMEEGCPLTKSFERPTE
jgi:hypothetical protein